MEKTEMRGSVEYLGDGVLSGWLLNEPDEDEITVELHLNGVLVGQTKGGVVRDDVELPVNEGDSEQGKNRRGHKGIKSVPNYAPVERAKSGHARKGSVPLVLDDTEPEESLPQGWMIVLPPQVFTASPRELKVFFRRAEALEAIWRNDDIELIAGYDFFIEKVDAREICGWARDRLGVNRNLPVVLWDENAAASGAFADRYMQSVKDAGYGDGNFGYVLRVPLGLRFQGNRAVAVGVLAPDGFVESETVHLLRGDVKALFLTNGDGGEKMARHYRSHVNAQLMWRCGVETVVVEDSSIEVENFRGFDIVVLQNCKNNYAVFEGIAAARRGGAIILFDFDGNNHVLPFLDLADGNDLEGDGDLLLDTEAVAALSLLHLSDAVTVPTEALGARFRDHGFHTIVAPNLIDDRLIRDIKTNAVSNYGWKLVFIADNSDRLRDFELIRRPLGRFLAQNQDVSLNIISERAPLGIESLSNVRFYGALSFTERLAVISESNLVLIPLGRSPTGRCQAAAEFVEAASQGVRILASDHADLGQMIEEAGAGHIVPDVSDWETALTAAYGERFSEAKTAASLIDYAARKFSISSAGNLFINNLIALHDKVACGRGVLC